MQIEYTIIIANTRNSIKENKGKGIFLIDRHTPIGNPYILHDEADRHMVCCKYNKWFYEEGLRKTEVLKYLYEILDYLKKYKTTTLLCWCTPKECHGETIKEWLLQQISMK